jgi:uncharacterized protein VirK/YbjX
MCILAAFATGFGDELRRMGPARAARRLLRSAAALRMRPAHDALAASPSLRRQRSLAWDPDPFFYLANRHYLIQGLSRQQRVAAALHHYAREDASAPAYREAVYGAGLVLWREATAEATYEVRLAPAAGVLFEGGLSVTLLAGGTEACMISFSVVPTASLGLGGPGMPAEVILVGRKQQARDHGWQADFNRAFNHTAPPRLALAALAGVAAAQGIGGLLCVAAERHPNFTEERRAAMIAGYDEFWATMAGADVAGVGRLLRVPLDAGPVDHLDRSKRKRALARRAHMARVSDSAAAALHPLLGPAYGACEEAA